MKSSAIFVPLMGMLLLLLGCSSVRMPQHLPAELVPADKERLEGTWSINDDAVFSMRFDTNGVAQVAGLDWDDGQFRISRAEAVVTPGKAHNFLSVRIQEDDGDWDGYFFCAYTINDNDDLILWAPVPEVFKEKVDAGELQGSVEKGKYSIQVSVTNSPAEILELINVPDDLSLFDYREPLVLRKIGKKD